MPGKQLGLVYSTKSKYQANHLLLHISLNMNNFEIMT